MNNSSQIYNVIQNIAATSSKTEKEAIIKSHLGDAEFLHVLVAALDPMTTYGIAKVPERDPARPKTGGQFDKDVWDVLKQLASRELTGNAARERVQTLMNYLDADSAALLKCIITKDLRAGFSESTVNKAIPGLIATFDCMLAHPFKDYEKKVSFPAIAEPKLDGVRVLAFVLLHENSVKFFSRSGKEFTTFDHLKAPILNMVRTCLEQVKARTQDSAQALAEMLPEVVFDGEMVSGSFNKTVGDVRRKSEQATDAEFNIFDMLPMATFKSEDKKGCQIAGNYSRRRINLKYTLGFASKDAPLKLLPSYLVNSVSEIHLLYEKVRARGLEGLIVKDMKGLYHRRRNAAWLKIKAEESVDVEIVDAEPGTGKYEGMLGALIVDYNGVRVNVGSGLSDDQRKSFWDAYQQDQRAMENEPEMIGTDIYLQLIGRLIEVEYHEVTPDGSLRHPRFKRFRDDKPLKEAA